MSNFCPPNGTGNTNALTEREPQTFRSEAELEAAIGAAYLRLCAAPWEQKPVVWDEFSRLVKQRSASRVRFMERTKGLA